MAKDKKACESWFNMYKDEDEDVISPEGANQFFNDLGISLESVSYRLPGNQDSSTIGLIW